MNCIIILTATITPNSWAGQLSEPAKRRKLYIQALKWYLANTNYKIVFAENSGECIQSNLDEFSTNRLEFLTFNDPPDKPDKGKGYKEMKILEYVYKNSTYLSEADLVVKVTGKLICNNICAILDDLIGKEVTNFISCTVNMSNSYTDSRFFVFSPSFLNILLKYRSKMDYSFGFEDALLSSLNEYKSKGIGEFVYLPMAPIIDGYSGRYDTKYKSGYLSFIKLSLKHFLKKMNYKFRYK